MYAQFRAGGGGRVVREFGTPELSALIDDMFLTMYVAEGAGLAAKSPTSRAPRP
ncbi:hypothetical protein OG946_17635 [Streptomyces sp. NBC_01808]|nr:hypothetical protein OG946_17635 [Streptomyces sp. NBC_01808]